MSGKSYTERARALRPYIEQASESLPDSDAAKAATDDRAGQRVAL